MVFWKGSRHQSDDEGGAAAPECSTVVDSAIAPRKQLADARKLSEIKASIEEALQMAADGTLPEANAVPLCHTCRIVKPLRSKHCSVRKKCVPMFDHYCPYIGNTIGGGNYLQFVVFIFAGMLGVLAHFGASVQYLYTVDARSALAWFMAIDLGLVSLKQAQHLHLSVAERGGGGEARGYVGRRAIDGGVLRRLHACL